MHLQYVEIDIEASKLKTNKRIYVYFFLLF